MGLFDKYTKDSEKEFFGVHPKDSKKKPPGDDPENNEDDYDNPYEELNSLDKKKKTEEIRKLKIFNEKELKNLVEKSLVTNIFGEMSQSVRSNVIDQAKRKSKQWADILGVPNKERQIEELLADLGEEIRNGLVGDIERLVNDEVFE